MADPVSVRRYTNTAKPFDVLARPFHRINAPDYDLAKDPPDAGPARELRGAGEVYVGLDLPQDLVLRIRAGADGAVPLAIEINGRAVGAFTMGPGWSTRAMRVPAMLWRRDLNVVTLRPEGPLRVRGLRFERDGGELPLPCGMEGA